MAVQRNTTGPAGGLQALGNIAAGYSRSMTAISMQTRDPKIVQDPTRLAQFQIDLYYATTGFQITSRVIQDLHREDQMLPDMLRDA